MCTVSRVLGIALLGVLALSRHASAQSPSLDSLLILPPGPTTAADVLAEVGGTVNNAGSPIIRLESRRLANDILLDVLIDELPVLAPPIIVPWMRTEDLGILPAGTYNLTARLIWDYRIGPNSPFPDPWPFPDSDDPPLFPGPTATLMTTFTVVPEPTGVTLVLCGAMGMAAMRRRPRPRPRGDFFSRSENRPQGVRPECRR